MNRRFFGEEKDIEAAKQLGLEGDHTIFMMGSFVDYIDDLSSVAEEFREAGYVDAQEVIDAVEQKIASVQLPKGFALVGMKPVGADEPSVYGIVDFCGFGRG